ncbi:Uncharacterised protein [Mycobacteroides abscessus subsp. abscessus]|nr:Uncharacterised protein [Mycobacteroides abscessus subsp. abscessus]
MIPSRNDSTVDISCWAPAAASMWPSIVLIELTMSER